MNDQQKKRLSQTTDLAKVMVNTYNNELLLAGLLNEQGANRINSGARQELTAILKLFKSTIRRIESCFTPEFLKTVKEQLTDENLTLQTDGAMDSFLKLSVSDRDFIEGVMNEMITASSKKDAEKQQQIQGRVNLYYQTHNAPLPAVNSLLITAKSMIR